jgi:hypothetical protein
MRAAVRTTVARCAVGLCSPKHDAHTHNRMGALQLQSRSCVARATALRTSRSGAVCVRGAGVEPIWLP